MGFWSWLRGEQPTAEQPAEARAITFQDVWGVGRDVDLATNVSMDRALSLDSVYAATSLIADLVSSFPLHGYRKTADARTELDPQPKLCTAPSVYGSPVDWVHRAVISLALRGNAFGMITERDLRGYPQQIEWLHPDDVSITDNRAEGRPDWRFRGRPLDPSMLLHIPYYTVPGFVLGLSPIKAYALTIDVGLFSRAFGRDWFRNGSIPAGILKTDQRIDDENRADIVKARFKRDAARREPVVLGSGLEYQMISVPPEDSQFLATIRATATQVAAIYHLDPTLIGGEHAGSSLTYANVEQRSLDLVKISLMPYIRRIEAALFSQLPGQQYIRFAVDAFIRPDTAARFNAYKLALDSGWMSKDEVRALEDLPPMPKGLGGFTDPIQQAQKLAAATAKPTGPTGDGQPAGGPPGAGGAGPGGNGSGPGAMHGATGTTNGARALPWADALIGLAGRSSDPWA